MPLLALGAIGVVCGEIGTRPPYALKAVLGSAHPDVFTDPPLIFEPMETTFVLSRDRVSTTTGPGMAPWREHLFAWMTRDAADADGFRCIPSNRVVELGSRIEI